MRNPPISYRSYARISTKRKTTMNREQLERIADQIEIAYRKWTKITFQMIAIKEKWSKEKREEWKDILDIK